MLVHYNGNMPKSKPHLILLLNTGIKPRELIGIGYSKSAVYHAYRKWKKATIDYQKDLRRIATVKQ